MKHAFCREVRFAGNRNAALAAASRRLTGRPFKAGALVPPSGSRAASPALESHPVEVCHLIRRSATGYGVGLPRLALKGRPTLRCRYAAKKNSKLQRSKLRIDRRPMTEHPQK